MLYEVITNSQNQLLWVNQNGSRLADYQYDVRGNMTLRGQTGQQSTHEYDALNRMTRAYGSARIGGSYDERYRNNFV